MALKKCENGHTFEKSSSCPVCPICSSDEMNEKYDGEFPKIGAPAFRALDAIGITKLSELSHYTEEQMLALHGFGPKALGLLKARLEKNGLTFLKKE